MKKHLMSQKGRFEFYIKLKSIILDEDLQPLIFSWLVGFAEHRFNCGADHLMFHEQQTISGQFVKVELEPHWFYSSGEVDCDGDGGAYRGGKGKGKAYVNGVEVKS